MPSTNQSGVDWGSIKWPKTRAKEAALTGKNATDVLDDANDCVVVDKRGKFIQ